MFASRAVPSSAMLGLSFCVCTPRVHPRVCLSSHLRVQVADAVSDTGIDDWVAMLADKVATTTWSDSSQASPMLRILWQLPLHLLQRVIAAYLSKCDLEHLLSVLPTVLHPAVVSTAAASGHITLPCAHLGATLSLLAPCSASPPGLLSLGLPKKWPPGVDVVDSFALLAHTLSQHASLTSLSLASVVLPAAAVLELSRGLVPGSLRNLVSLKLATQMHPNGCAAVAGCLKSLNALTILYLDLPFTKSPSSTAPDLASFVQAASCPADLSCLKKLTLKERHRPHTHALQPTSQSCLHLLPPLISAPSLADLCLFSDVANGSFARLLDCLSHFTAVQTLTVTAAMVDSGPAPRRSPSTRPSTRSAGSSPVGCYMPALQRVGVTSGCHVVQLTMAAAIAARSSSSLTSLILQQDQSDANLAGCNLCSDKQQQAWAAFVPVLRQCTGLRSLELSSLCSADGSADGSSDGSADTNCQALTGALRRLPLLTHLSLTARCRQCAPPAAPIPLRGDLLGVALQGLTGLESLAVVGEADELAVSGQEVLLTALPVLQRLTLLGLCFADVQRVQLADLIPKLPAMKQCKLLPGVPGESEEATAAFRAQFPDVTFTVHNSSA